MPKTLPPTGRDQLDDGERQSGSWHAREAVLLLEQGCEFACPFSGCQHEQAQLARAQVHATLALTATAVSIAMAVTRRA